jgi:hypothetical protein
MGKRDTENDFLLTCCVVETSSFMKKLLPVNERLIEEILCRMKAQGHYLNGRWKDFPEADSLGQKDLSADTDSLDEDDASTDADSLDQEDSFPAVTQEDAVLAAFVNVANVIRKAAEEVMKAEGDLHPDCLGVNEWVDYHSRPPISEDKDDIGPNALLSLTRLEEHNDGVDEVRRNILFFGINIFNEYP